MDSSDFKPGYHLVHITKGEIGCLSKIQEELDELKDAENQNSKILIIVELADLFGAVELYAEKLGITLDDLHKFSNITRRAFENGRR